jgi:hypothetical protein
MAGRRNQYRPDYPRTLEDYIRRLRQIRREYSRVSDNIHYKGYISGYCFAMQTAINMANDLKRNMKRKT